MFCGPLSLSMRSKQWRKRHWRQSNRSPANNPINFHFRRCPHRPLFIPAGYPPEPSKLHLFPPTWLLSPILALIGDARGYLILFVFTYISYSSHSYTLGQACIFFPSIIHLSQLWTCLARSGRRLHISSHGVFTLGLNVDFSEFSEVPGLLHQTLPRDILGSNTYCLVSNLTPTAIYPSSHLLLLLLSTTYHLFN